MPPVSADLNRIKEAVVRLIDNANLYSPKDSPITITAEQTGDFSPPASPTAARASTTSNRP